MYKGAYAASIRDFAKATSLFLDTVSTFTSYEIMEYKKFVETAVLLGMFSLPRVELHKKVVLGPEIQEMLHESPTTRGFMQSFYKCDYATFFKHLGNNAYAQHSYACLLVRQSLLPRQSAATSRLLLLLCCAGPAKLSPAQAVNVLELRVHTSSARCRLAVQGISAPRHLWALCGSFLQARSTRH